MINLSIMKENRILKQINNNIKFKMKKNINYDLVTKTISYRIINKFKLKIFSEYVKIYQKIDWELYQIKYLYSKQNNIFVSNNLFSCKTATTIVILSSFINWIFTIVSTVITKFNAEISLLFSFFFYKFQSNSDYC